jgi:hypothetical protein
MLNLHDLLNFQVNDLLHTLRPSPAKNGSGHSHVLNTLLGRTLGVSRGAAHLVVAIPLEALDGPTGRISSSSARQAYCPGKSI